jgi:hypothetical protein
MVELTGDERRDGQDSRYSGSAGEHPARRNVDGASERGDTQGNEQDHVDQNRFPSAKTSSLKRSARPTLMYILAVISMPAARRESFSTSMVSGAAP